MNITLSTFQNLDPVDRQKYLDALRILLKKYARFSEDEIKVLFKRDEDIVEAWNTYKQLETSTDGTEEDDYDLSEAEKRAMAPVPLKGAHSPRQGAAPNSDEKAVQDLLAEIKDLNLDDEDEDDEYDGDADEVD